MSDPEERERVWVECDQCGGISKVEPKQASPDGFVFVRPGFIKTCPRCNGEGGWYLEEESDG